MQTTRGVHKSSELDLYSAFCPSRRIDSSSPNHRRESGGRCADSAVAMPVIVYEAPHTTRHIAERCSCAFIVSLAILVATILVPYFVAFHTSACPNRPVIF